MPSGSAPTHARFAAHSSTAAIVPRRGSAATRRPLPSMLTASALPSGSASTAASACSGRRIVREPTIESYCSKSGRREARFGLASSAGRISWGEASGASTAAGGAYSGSAGLAGCEVIQRAVVDERAHRHVAEQLAVAQHAHPSRCR